MAEINRARKLADVDSDAYLRGLAADVDRGDQARVELAAAVRRRLDSGQTLAHVAEVVGWSRDKVRFLDREFDSYSQNATLSHSDSDYHQEVRRQARQPASTPDDRDDEEEEDTGKTKKKQRLISQPPNSEAYQNAVDGIKAIVMHPYLTDRQRKGLRAELVKILNALDNGDHW